MDTDDILFSIKELNNSIFQVLMKENPKKKCPSPTQFKIIFYLLKHKNEEIYQKDIELHLGISRATVSDVLNTMEKNNLIKRTVSKKDSRTKRVTLNNIPMEEYNKTLEKLKNMNEILKKNINKEELDVFIRVLNQMRNNLNTNS